MFNLSRGDFANKALLSYLVGVLAVFVDHGDLLAAILAWCFRRHLGDAAPLQHCLKLI